MKPRFFSLPVSLLLAAVLSACASAPPSEAAVPLTPVQEIATSRGPELEATDPTTVSLASGQLQLVEFFRFT